MRAYTLDIDGTKTEAVPANGKDFQLEEMYDLTGSIIVEIHRLPGRKEWIVMDEEGIRNEKPVNAAATVLAHNLNGPVLGKVLVCEQSMVE